MDFIITEENILERVDEYTLYCFYLGYDPEIQTNYTSPFRADDQTPSFGLYPCKRYKCEYMWKDAGGKGMSGDVIRLVQELYGYKTKRLAVARIISDMRLGPHVEATERIIHTPAKIRSDADIRVKPRSFREQDLAWWAQWNISEEILKRFRVSALFCYWLRKGQAFPIYGPAFSYVYRIYEKYQLYFPKAEKGRKFRMDLQDEHILGLEQITFKSDTLIITKSYKDVMCLASYGYEAISPRSENIPLPEGFSAWADQHYRRKLILFDNDDKHRADWYPYPQIEIPRDSGSKDISDFTRDHSPAAAAELLKRLIT